jgi:ribokinase
VIGSANLDFTVALPRLPRPGETVTGGALLVNGGGKGANQALAARRLGGEVRMIGCTGSDRSGDEIRAELGAAGVDVNALMRAADTATGTALILVDAAGQNQIGVAPGANHRLTVDMVRPHEAAIAWAQVLLCQLETPTAVVHWALEAARRHGVLTILNPAPVQPLGDELLGLVDYLTPNEIEAGMLAGVEVSDAESARHAAERLRARGARHVVVTRGARGALVCDGGGVAHVAAFPVDVVDTTAAGDAFNGALAVGLADGTSLDGAIALASAAAALTCTRRGAQDALPDRAAVDHFLRRQER